MSTICSFILIILLLLDTSSVFYKRGRNFNNNFNFFSDPFIPQEPFYDQQPYQMVPTIKQECPWSQYDCNQELCDSWSSHSSSGGYRSVQSSPTDIYTNDSKPMIQAAALAGYSGNTRSHFERY